LCDGEKRSDQILPYIDVKFLRGEKVAEMVTSGKFAKKGNFLILVDGENSGEVFLSSCDGYQGSTFKQLKINNVYEEYVLLIIQMSRKILRENKVGSAIPHLNKKIFRAIQVSLPPYQEQIRIVGEVAKLNRLIDAILESL
jgi:type I restriction enzyme S subunit